MKRLLTGALALLLSVSASATTLNPVQLLNPTGSSSGQAIVSTGASTAPGWANVSATSLAAQAANTVVANVTGSSASPTAFAMPLCNAATAALQYTTGGTGFVCNTAINAATLGGATFAAPGPIGSTTASTGAFTTLSSSGVASLGTGSTVATSPLRGDSTSKLASTFFVQDTLLNPPAIGSGTAAAGSFTTLTATGAITPSQTAGIVGTTTNNNANAGSVGEFITSSVASGSAVSLTSGAAANVTSISLTAGDWDVWGQVSFLPAGSTTTSNLGAWISTTSATFPATLQTTAIQFFALSSGAGAGSTIATGMTRLNLASTTTVFLEALSTFGVSTDTAYGFIAARRCR